MINQRIIEEIVLSPLMVDDKYLQAIAFAAFAAYQNKTPLQSLRYEAAYAINPATGAKQTEKYSKGSVGMVVIDGPIVSDSDAWNGIKGTIEAGQELQQLDDDPNICATVFYMESGGGPVYALKPILNIMSGLTKPVVLFSKQVLASAAYRIGAECDYIMMYHPQGIVGSIGTMNRGSDLQPMFEKWGMKFYEYYATESTLKNKTFNDAKAGDGTALIKNFLNPMNEQFIADIKRLRPAATSENIYKGETYMAEKGMKKGLIDGIGSLSDAVQMAVALSKAKPSAKTPNNPDMKFPKIFALAGLNTATQEQLTAANAELTEAGITGFGIYPESVITDAAAVTTERDGLQTTNGKLTTDLATANTNLAAAQLAEQAANAKVTALEAKLALAPAAVAPAVAATETVMEKTAAEINQEEIDNLPHNKAIANNPLFNKPKKA